MYGMDVYNLGEIIMAHGLLLMQLRLALGARLFHKILNILLRIITIYYTPHIHFWLLASDTYFNYFTQTYSMRGYGNCALCCGGLSKES